MKYKSVFFLLFFFFSFSPVYAQDTLGFSADLYKYLIKNDDFNKDGILSESEIDYVCCVQIVNFKSIKGLSRLKNLKSVTIEIGDFSLDELFELKELKRLTVTSKKGRKTFTIPQKCNFSLELTNLSIDNCVFNIEDNKFENIKEININGCEIIYDISKIFYYNNIMELSINNSLINHDIHINSVNESLESLTLNSINLPGIPNTINNLKNLKSLSVANNNLSNLPESIKLLESLNSLNLSENNFDSFPEILLYLKELKYLYLIRNKKEIALPENINRLSKLENVPIILNCINGIPEEIFKIKNLKNLTLSNCNLKTIPKKVFALNKLESLILSNNQITEISPDLLKLKYLKLLNLNSNKLSRIPDWIGSFEYLSELNLSHNEISDFDFNITKMCHLKIVNLDFNKLKDFPYVLNHCKNLEFLTLNNNSISSLDRLKYGDFNKITEIEISNNLISEIPGLFHHKFDLEIKEKTYDTSMEEPYNNLNIVEEVLVPRENMALFTCNILSSARVYSKYRYKVKIVDCFYGVCDMDTFYVNSDKFFKIGSYCIINGHLDIHNKSLDSYFNYFQINATYEGFDDKSYMAGRKEYFEIAAQLSQYRKTKYTGKVKLNGKDFTYAEGEFIKGNPHGTWSIYFAHKEISGIIKSELNFYNGKLHGPTTKFLFKNGILHKSFVEDYIHGSLQKKEEFKYIYEKLYTIEGVKYSYQAPFNLKYIYTIDADNHDTLGTSLNVDLNQSDNSKSSYDNIVSLPSFYHGKWQFVHFKNVRATGEYFMGMKIGVWYSNERCCSDTIAIYEKPENNKNIIAYYGNGKTMIEGSIINKKKEGIWKVFSEKGDLTKTFSYKNDILDGNVDINMSSQIIRRTYIDGTLIHEETIKKTN